MAFRLVTIGGLGNRLRQILSHRAREGAIDVLWARSPSVCGARWSDVFEPLRAVNFVDAGAGHGHDVTLPCDEMYAQIAEGAPPWTRGYQELVPVPEVHSRVVSTLLTMPAHFHAIHARRGDHAAHAPAFGHFTTNEELLEWHRSQPSPSKLYLATDCPDTLAWFGAHVSDLVHGWTPGRSLGYEARTGTLADAVVDLFVCASARAFRGSWMSSFSETVDMIRCRGEFSCGFVAREHMPSGEAEFYRGRPDRARGWHVLRGYA